MAPYLGNGDEVSTPRARLQQIECSGTPYEIGFQHGSEGKLRISRTIAFYTEMFKLTAKKDWEAVRKVASTFEPVIGEKWPNYLEEMRGVAEGAGVPLSDIVACNARTEIAFGLFSDGCTALAWLTSDSKASYLAQNWDWQEAQKENLLLLTIDQSTQHLPTIQMVTEAGIIGKIGFNSAGVGVCLNAIRVRGMDSTRLPCHLALRKVLDSNSREEAVQALESYGVAAACHILIADAETGGIGLECSSVDIQKVTQNAHGQIFHANHYLLPHPSAGLDEKWLIDSTFRTKRIKELAEKLPESPSAEQIYQIFEDEKNWPGAICRAQKVGSEAATLFNIVMDLKTLKAKVSLGRPVDPDEVIELRF